MTCTDVSTEWNSRSDSRLVVIAADTDDGRLVVLEDEDHPDEAAVYLSDDPAVGDLIESWRDVYPSVRVMPVDDYAVLCQLADAVHECEVDTDLAALPDDLATWAGEAEFAED